jgi:nucleoside-diphosphate-sugar epimerase
MSSNGHAPRRRRLLVTGGPGILGSMFVPRFVAAGFDVQSIALEPWPDAPCPHLVCDLQSLGETIEMMRDRDAVVHLAAVNRENVRTRATTFHMNVATTFNVLHAATIVGVPRVVWASSCHTGGGRWSRDHGPTHVPIRESDPYQTGDTYGLSKIAGEAIMQHERAWPGLSIVALRYGYVHETTDYEQIRDRWADPEYWAHSLWNYVDARDAFEATRLAVEQDFSGSHVLYVTAADQSMDTPTRELVAEYWPDARVDESVAEFGSLMCLDAIRELLGFIPKHSWREVLATKDAVRK